MYAKHYKVVIVAYLISPNWRINPFLYLHQEASKTYFSEYNEGTECDQQKKKTRSISGFSDCVRDTTYCGDIRQYYYIVIITG